jgi:hypothetical protein
VAEQIIAVSMQPEDRERIAGRNESVQRVGASVQRFVAWLDHYGETSYDHQSYFAGPIGRRAKALYYRRPRLGTLAVAPMIASEALLPSARRLFWRKQRFPIADAHYAMAYAALARPGADDAHYRRAVHFLDVLEQTRCPGYRHHAWGYPFDWVTRTGVMTAQTPLITSTPYAYEAFAAVHGIDGQGRWLDVMQSIAEHALLDIHDKPTGPGAASAGYNPHDVEGGVVNASAYRAFLLFSAAKQFARNDFRLAAERNLAYVLQSQQADGSWPYATDGVRDFVDHFHTCFVLKALAKIDAQDGPAECRAAIESGVGYYVHHLFDDRGLPRPFAKAPRLTVYRRELYDYAECINVGTLLGRQFPELEARLHCTIADLLRHWQKSDGSFQSRRLLLGWDSVPMHRWAQAQVFRSLACWLRKTGGVMPATAD